MEKIVEYEIENNSSLACSFLDSNIEYDEIMSELEKDDILKKQACILLLTELKSYEDAKKLLNNLVNQDGRIREVCAFKVNELIKTFTEHFQTDDVSDVFLKSIVDVNPSICRFIISILNYVENKKYLVKNIIEQIEKLIITIKNEPKNARKYYLNKKIFKIYWLLEALIAVYEQSYEQGFEQNLENIIIGLSNFEEYTIREKIHKLALCLSAYNANRYKSYLLQFQNDENFYVRQFRKTIA